VIPDYPWFGPRHGMGRGLDACELARQTDHSSGGRNPCRHGAAHLRALEENALYLGGSVVFLLAVCIVTSTAPG